MIRPLFIFLLLLSIKSYAQPPSEIYLFDLNLKKNQIGISNGKNITNHKGYDNQPFFHPQHTKLYFVQADTSGRTDILVYDYSADATKKVTATSEREYSPTVTPDEKFLSCIIQRDDGAQDLGKYPIDGGSPVVLINNLKVGYHAWADNDNMILFVLGEPHTLHWYSVPNNKDSIIIGNIGRSLHKIPSTADVSFVDKTNEKWRIKRIDVKNKKVLDIAETLPGKEDFAWTSDGRILMSDGNKLYYYHPGKSNAWQEVEGLSALPLTGITRLSINKKGNKIAIVANE